MPGNEAGLANAANRVVDVFGPAVEFLTPLEDREAVYCMLKGTIAPGIFVPLHSHPDDESFFVLSGSVQFLQERGDRLEWITVRTGEFIHVAGNAKHAFRNVFDEPVVQLITTTAHLGRFFEEIGRPISSGGSSNPPTPEELEQLARASAKYNYWLGSAEENAAVGIFM